MTRRTLGLLVVLLASILQTARADALPPRSETEGEDLAARPLELADVLESAERAYPMLLAAKIEREATEAGLLEARGAFDTRLSASGEAAPTGFYDRYQGGLDLEQPTRLWGARFFGGYRIGRGDYPAYLGGEETNESGELSAGVEVPLLRDRATDEDRTRLLASELQRRAAEPRIAIERIDVMRQAAERFWGWVARGLTVEVERTLLATAEARQVQLEGRVKRGAAPRIELLDNQRLIVDRASRLRGAEREAIEAALELSLFLRDESGEPVVPTTRVMPESFPEETLWGEARLESDLAQAVQRHPILRELALRRNELEAKLALERNRVLPDVRLRVEGSKDFGTSVDGIDSTGDRSNNPKDDTEIKAQIRVELPLLQRRARGRAERTRLELKRLDHRIRLARDRIQTEIRGAMATLRVAFDQTDLARQNFELARQLERAEERKLSLGSSNLIDVNIRERQTADAARSLISAQAAYFRAVARYEAAAATYVQ